MSDVATDTRVRAHFGGRYRLTNMADCVRLVLDSRLHRQRQEAMLDVIARTPGAPSREEVLQAIKAEGGKGQ